MRQKWSINKNYCCSLKMSNYNFINENAKQAYVLDVWILLSNSGLKDEE